MTLEPNAREEETHEVTLQHVPGPWRLEIGTLDGSLVAELEPARALVLGAGRAADVCIADPTVSARHCRIVATASGVVVEDIGSKNGVYVGAARVQRATLSGRAATFVIGRTTVVVREARTMDSEIAAESIPGLVGASPIMQRVAEQVRRHARLKAPVLIRGESGTGKDLVAQALHRLSGRKGAYVPLNVGALPESLADAELFGHRRGAFTGAVATRAGAFEQAQEGTLFLDEVAELPGSIQIKLLRVVEDGLVRPVGSTEAVRVDVRILSATWAPLEDWVALKRFRADLLHRLGMVVIELPPLRQRRSDVPMLSQALLARFRPEVGPKHLSSAAIAKLVSHSFPGNVRELGAVLYRAAVATDGPLIDACHVELRSPVKSTRRSALTSDEARTLLERHSGNTARAARDVGVARSTFRSWLMRETG